MCMVKHSHSTEELRNDLPRESWDKRLSLLPQLSRGQFAENHFEDLDIVESVYITVVAWKHLHYLTGIGVFAPVRPLINS